MNRNNSIGSTRGPFNVTSPVLLTEHVWAETIQKRHTDGLGAEYKVPYKINRKPVPYWLLDSESPYSKAGVQPIAYVVTDSFTTKAEEFPLRHHLKTVSVDSSVFTGSHAASLPPAKAIEIMPDSKLKKLANRLSKIF